MSGYDDLAAGGIFNFDSEAYVKGMPPRYAGNPYGNNALPFDGPLVYPAFGLVPGPYLAGAPVQDAFNDRYHQRGHKISLATILTGSIVGALAIWAGCKVKTTFFPKGLKETGVAKFCKSCKDKIFPEKKETKAETKTAEASKIEPAKTETPAKSETKKTETPAPKTEIKPETKVEDAAKKAVKKGGWFKKALKGTGIAALVGVGILAAYQGIRIIKAGNERKKEMQNLQNSQMIGNIEPAQQVQSPELIQPTEQPQQAEQVPQSEQIQPIAQVQPVEKVPTDVKPEQLKA